MQPKSVTITGTGSVSGGLYQRVNILGEAELFGDIQCESFKCTGNSHSKGSMTARKYRLQGEASISGDLKAVELTSLGQIDVEGAVRGGKMTVRGQLSAGGSCEADRLTVKGAVSVGGLLSAEQLDISLYGPSEAKEIGVGTISVKRKAIQTIKQWFTPQGAAELRAGTIEGDTIYLEHTTADVVRGNRVELGPGCKIGLVEYRDVLKKSGSAAVGSELKV
ncbi:bactofilin [Paenibacillus humicola]|uniref:bactofilin n=1 Tax=Paenibacillus humicola TaxID=3110540 RepID=UPI00237A4E2A|nr:bactofilin [Paenibacillus humicola]